MQVEILACDEEANLEVDLENKKIGETRITEADKQRLLESVQTSYGRAVADASRSGSEDEADVDLMATKQDEQMDSDDEEGGESASEGEGAIIENDEEDDGDEEAIDLDPLYCICQTTYDPNREMVERSNPQCEFRWLHIECLDMTKKDFKKIGAEHYIYTCPECTQEEEDDYEGDKDEELNDLL